MDIDLLVAVAEDLEYLSTWGGDISNAEIRRGSAILRKLLVDDSYSAAWRAIGEEKQPSVIAVDLSLMINNIEKHVVYALAGGVLFKGIHTACMLLTDRSEPIGNQPPEPIRDNGYPFERKFYINDFLSSLSGVVDGREFNRRDVIKYIANVKGGVHINAKPRKEEEKLISRVGKIEKKIMMHNADGLLIEILAIGQAVGKSDDAVHFIKRVYDIERNQ